MDKEMKPTSPTNESAQNLDNTVSQQQISNSRRRFAKSVAGSGIVLSLASKPVMGANYWCTGSGGMSGNTSSHGDKVSCLACSPGYWKASPGTWPSPYYPYNICNCSGGVLHQPTKFADALGYCPYGDKSMMWVLQNQSGSREFHAIGALLNAAKAAAMGLTSAYTPYEIKQMYLNGAPTSTFSGTYEGTMHNCPLPSSNDNMYQAEGAMFCKVIGSNGLETQHDYHC